MNKGFTLIELLAVIIILSLIAALVSTSVTKIVKDSKNDLYKSQMSSIKSAAEAWGADNPERLPNSGECKFLTLGDLKESGLLDSNIKNPKTNSELSDDMIIKISTEETIYDTSNIIYEVDSNDVSLCKFAIPICTLVDDVDNSETPTVGDKYTCKVKDVMETEYENGYTFYVLSLSTSDENKVNLIMDRNICEDGTLTDANKGDKCLVAYNSSGDTVGVGPVTAMEYLNNATNIWKEELLINETYDDEGENFTNFKLNGKARLPRYDEVANSNGTNNYLYENLNGSNWVGIGQQPINNINGIIGYWTLSSNKNNSGEVWNVYFNGYLSAGIASHSAGPGVRPVITVDKKYLNK